MTPFIPAIVSFVLMALMATFWQMHHSGHFLARVFSSLRVPIITIFFICGVVYFLAASANVIMSFWLGRSEGPTLEQIVDVQNTIKGLISSIQAHMPPPFAMALLALFLLLIASIFQADAQMSLVLRIATRASAWAGVALAALSTLTLLPGSLAAAPATLALEVARTQQAMSEIEAESQSLASSEIANELFHYFISSLSESDRQSISRSLNTHQERIRNLNDLARRNHSSSGSQLSRLSSRLAPDWTARASQSGESIRRALPQIVRPLPSEIIQEINKTPIRRIQNVAHLLRIAPVSGAVGENANISQIRQSFINNSTRFIIDRLGASSLRAAISSNPLAQQFLEAITDAMINEANDRYQARRNSLVVETLRYNELPRTGAASPYTNPVNRHQIRSGILGRISDADMSLNDRVDCSCTRVPGGIIWTLSNVTLEQCYSRRC